MVLAVHALLHHQENHGSICSCGLDFQPDHPSNFWYILILDDLLRELLLRAHLYHYPDSLEHYVPTKKAKHLGIVLSGEHNFNAQRKKIVEDSMDLAYWAIQAQIWTLTIYQKR